MGQDCHREEREETQEDVMLKGTGGAMRPPYAGTEKEPEIPPSTK